MFPNKRFKTCRLPRTLLVMNFAVTLKEADEFFYCEWNSLKKYLSRAERLALVRAVANGVHYLVTEDNGYVSTVEMV